MKPQGIQDERLIEGRRERMNRNMREYERIVRTGVKDIEGGQGPREQIKSQTKSPGQGPGSTTGPGHGRRCGHRCGPS